MKTIQSLKTNLLYCRQPKWSRDDYELRSQSKGKDDSDLVGTLAWTQFLSETACAASAGGCWTFEEQGFLDPSIVVRDGASDAEVMRVSFGWLGNAAIQLTDGANFEWFQSKILGPAWIVADSHQETIFELESGYHWFKREGIIHLNMHNLPSDHLDLLLLLGIYLAVYRQRKTAVVVAATTAVF